MHGLKHLLKLSVTGLLVLALSACGGASTAPSAAPEAAAPATESAAAPAEASAETPAPASGEKKTVAITIMFSHPYFDSITKGISDTLGPDWEVVQQSGENNTQAQIEQIENFVSMGVDFIVAEPFDWQAIKPGLEAANKAGIPILCADAPAFDEDLIVANVGSDNYEAGVQGALHMIEKLGGKGNIVVLTAPTTKTGIDRVDGFKETIAKNAPDMKILYEQAGNYMQDEALAAMENILQATKDFQGVFAANEEMAMGAISALEGEGLVPGTDVMIYSVNGAQKEIDMIKLNKLEGTSCQQPYLMGQMAGQVILDAMAGNPPADKTVPVPVLYVDKNNMDTYVPIY